MHLVVTDYRQCHHRILSIRVYKGKRYNPNLKKLIKNNAFSFLTFCWPCFTFLRYFELLPLDLKRAFW